MFKVNGLTKGNCDGDDTHADREVLLVEDTLVRQSLKLCQKCFMAQLKLRSKGRKVEADAHENGRAHPVTT